MVDRAQRYRGRAEGDHRRRMAVHNRHYVWSCLIDRAVNGSLQMRPPEVAPRWSTIQSEFHNIASGDELRGHRTREQEVSRLLGVTPTHMTVCVKDPMLRKDEVGVNNIFDECC